MEILPSTLAPAQASLKLAPGDLIKGWVIGQVLEATVLAVTAPDRAVLAMAGRRFEAQTETPPHGNPLRPGERLALQVASNGSPAVLKVLQPPAPATDTGEVQRAAVREALPRAEPLAPALATLARLAAAPAVLPRGGLPQGLPPETVHAVRHLLRSVPDLARLVTADGLREAVEDSGVFLESRLAALPTAAPPPAGDLKGALLVLAGLLSRATAEPKTLGQAPTGAARTTPDAPAGQTSPPQATPDVLARQPNPPRAPAATVATLPADPASDVQATAAARVEGALARIELNQLRSVPLADHPQPGWLVEVPFRTPSGFDLLTLRIDRAGRERRGRPPESWQVCVRLDLEPLGPVHATVRWEGGGVAATLRAEREATAALLERHAGELEQALGDAGLPNVAVRCLRGPVPAVVGHGLPDRLLDLRA